MIFAFARLATPIVPFSFSAIARSVMIFARIYHLARRAAPTGFSAIARSVMIFASKYEQTNHQDIRFSAIARSVMIFAPLTYAVIYKVFVAICRVPIFENTLIDKKTL